MKKTIHITIALVCLLATTKLYSQSEHQCFSLEQKSESVLEKTIVMFVRTGNNVDAQVKKDMIQAGKSYTSSWEMSGTIDGNKIVFNVPKKTVDQFNGDSNPIQGPKPIENWILRDGNLLMNEQVLKSGKCN